MNPFEICAAVLLAAFAVCARFYECSYESLITAEPSIAQMDAAAGGGPLSATLDYTSVENTENYVHPDSEELTAVNGHDVVDGDYTQTIDNTNSSFKIKQSVLDLSGKAVVSVKLVNWRSTTGSSYGGMFLTTTHSPGGITVLDEGTGTGYRFVIGSGGGVFIQRLVSGTSTDLGSRTTSVDGHDLEARVTIGDTSNSIQIYRDGVAFGDPIVDDHEDRPTDLACAGFFMRNAFGRTLLIEQFVAAEIVPE